MSPALPWGVVCAVWVFWASNAAGASPDVDATLDRTAFLETVLARNPGLQAAGDAVRGARARARASQAWDDPMLSVEAAPLSLLPTDPPSGLTARVSQALPTAGRLSARVEGAHAAVDLALADEAQVRTQLSLIALQAWDGWYLVHRQLAVNAEHDALLADLEVSARAALAAGRVGAQAPLAVSSERALLSVDRAMLEAERTARQAELNALSHAPAGQAQAPPPDRIRLGGAVTPGTPSVDRPELRGLDAAVAMAAADETLARAERRPMVGLMASYSTMWMEPAHRLMVGVDATLPLWMGAGRARVEAAQAEQARLGHERERVDDGVRSEVASAVARAEAARVRAGLQAERVLPIARERLDAARAGFAAGTADIDSVIDAERGLRSAELGLDAATAGWLDALAALDVARGHVADPSSGLE